MGSFISVRTTALDDLIESAQCNAGDDTPEMNKIIRRFEGLVVSVAWAMTPDVDLRDDLANAGRVAIVVAVRHHEIGRPGFPAYAKTYVIGAAKRELGSWTRTTLPAEFERVDVDGDVDAQALFKIAEDVPPVGDRTWGSSSTDAAVHHLDERQEELLQLRFMEDFSLATIAELQGTSQSAVSQRLTTALRVVERYMAA